MKRTAASYYPRYIEQEIERKLRSSGAIVVAGPKFCGKTTTCMRYGKSSIQLNTAETIRLAKLQPKGVLAGEKPRLIDEWQTVPDIWNQVKDDLDKEYIFGKYILTGSATPADTTEIYHSGAGRITPVKMKTLTLFESCESSGLVSLTGLFAGEGFEGFELNQQFSVSDLAFLICRGGWPIALVKDREQALDITKNYYDSLLVFEYSENETFRNKRTGLLKMILKSYARNISTEASLQTLIEDTKEMTGGTLDRKTFDEYLDALKSLYIIEDVSAWNPNIRSKTAVRATPTRHFTDTSIACRALNISPDDLTADLKTFGLFFEDFAVRDLSVYAQTLSGEIRHYRDNAGLECDAVIRLADGRWAAVEIKLGGEDLVEEGAQSLLRLKNKIAEKSDERAPSFLMVLTGVGPLYRREDGVFVVPINCLKA